LRLILQAAAERADNRGSIMIQFRGLRALALGASALTSLVAGQAFAQSSEPKDAGTIEEVIVTALKRSTTVQTTPISVSAVTEKSLQALGAQGIQDYFRTVPNPAGRRQLADQPPPDLARRAQRR
jgi:outer membrane receptor protein involved in Fe transport